MQLSVSLFGKVSVELSQRPLFLPNACKAQELFCYIFFLFERPHHREKLATLLWSDVSAEQAKAYLRKTIWQLQSALAPPGKVDEPIILTDSEWVQVNSNIDTWLDFRDFEAAHNQTQDTSAIELSSSDVALLRNAIQLYKGDLMEGLFGGWCLRERERFQLIYLSILEKLMSYCEFHGEYEAGLHYGTRILQQDEAREYTHQAMMCLHYLSGHRTAALRQYERCRAILEAELGVQPAKRTRMLFTQIKNEQFDHASMPLYDPGFTSSCALTQQLSEVTNQLHHIQAMLSDVQKVLKDK